MKKEEINQQKAEIRRQIVENSKQRNERLVAEKKRHYDALRELHNQHLENVDKIESEACYKSMELKAELDELSNTAAEDAADE